MGSHAKFLDLNMEFAAIPGTGIEISRFAGPNTRVIDAKGKTVLPGLYDSHVHSYRASGSSG